MSCASMAQKCPTDQDRATDYLLGAPWWASLLMSGFMASSRGQPFPSPSCPSLLWGSQLCEKLPLLKAWRQRPGGLLLSLSWKIVQCQKAQPKQTFLKRWRGLVGNGGRCLRQTKTNTNSDANKSSQNKGMLWRFMLADPASSWFGACPAVPAIPAVRVMHHGQRLCCQGRWCCLEIWQCHGAGQTGAIGRRFLWQCGTRYDAEWPSLCGQDFQVQQDTAVSEARGFSSQFDQR